MDKKQILAYCNATSPNTLMETLGIEYVDVGDDFIIARMPVTSRVHQPDGILHGGATAALAESIGSVAVFVFNQEAGLVVRGIEITANHVKSVRSGYVFAKASPIHLGNTIQFWEIRVTDENDKLVSLCKLTTYKQPKN